MVKAVGAISPKPLSRAPTHTAVPNFAGMLIQITEPFPAALETLLMFSFVPLAADFRNQLAPVYSGQLAVSFVNPSVEKFPSSRLNFKHVLYMVFRLHMCLRNTWM